VSRVTQTCTCRLGESRRPRRSRRSWQTRRPCRRRIRLGGAGPKSERHQDVSTASGSSKTLPITTQPPAPCLILAGPLLPRPAPRPLQAGTACNATVCAAPGESHFPHPPPRASPPTHSERAGGGGTQYGALARAAGNMERSFHAPNQPAPSPCARSSRRRTPQSDAGGPVLQPVPSVSPTVIRS
jgi:hypothetical protein